MEVDDTIDQRISSLKLDLKDLGKKILQHINVVHSSVDGSNIDLKNDPRNCIRSLRYDIDDILEISSSRTEYLEEYSNDLKKCNKLVGYLEAVNVAADTISRLEDSIATTDLKLVCNLLKQTDTLIANLPANDPDTAEYSNGFSAVTLRREASIQRCRFVTKLKRLLECFINLEHSGDGSIHVTSVLRQGGYTILGEETETRSHSNEDLNSIVLADCWDACLQLGIAEEIVSHICCQIWQQLIKPLWKVTCGTGTGSVSSTANTSSINPHVTKSTDSFNQPQACLNIPCISTLSSHPHGNFNISRNLTLNQGAHSRGGGTSASTSVNGTHYSDQLGTCKVSFPYLLDNIYAILHFLSVDMLCSKTELIAMAHVCLFQNKPLALGNTLCNALSGLIPESEYHLSGFKSSVEKPCREFEEKLKTVCKFPLVTVATATLHKNGPSGGSDGSTPLSLIVQEIDNKYCENRRKSILNKARTMLLADYHNIMYGTGDALEDDVASAGHVGDAKAMMERSGASAMQALSFDCCQISLAAWRVLSLIHDVMREACKPPSSSSSLHSAHMLYSAARDCLELFIAVIPIKFEELIESVPRMGAVFYNDCAYLAHNCTLITFKYRKEMKNLHSKISNVNMTAGGKNTSESGSGAGASGVGAMRDNIGFVDFIPRLRTLGQKCLAGHIEREKGVLLGYIEDIKICPQGEGGDDIFHNEPNNAPVDKGRDHSLVASGSLPSHHRSPEGADASGNAHGNINNDQGAVLVVKHLEQLQGQWHSVLPDNVYERIMGYLIECVIRGAVQPVQEADCIAATACTDIGRVFRILMKSRECLQLESSNSDNDSTGIGSALSLGFGSLSSLTNALGGSANNASSNNSSGNSNPTLHALIPSWNKFCVLTELLDFSISEVTEWLPRKKFTSFTAQELGALIKALFEDSVRRQNILNLILEMS